MRNAQKHGPVMAREIDDKGAANAGCGPLAREELHDVEQVAGMLPVHRRHQLAAIHILERDDRDSRSAAAQFSK